MSNVPPLKLLQQQVTEELYAALFYFAASSYADGLGLPNISAHFLKASAEEYQHADAMVRYLQKRKSTVVLGSVPAPPKNFSSLERVFEQALELEQLVSGLLDSIANAASDTGDHATYQFVQLFIAEQVDSVALYTEWMAKLQHSADWVVLDHAMHERQP